MKGNNILRKLAALLVVAVMTVMAIGPTPAAQAGNTNPGVIPLQAHPYSHTYGEWSARLWQWIFSIPVDDGNGHFMNPMLDPDGTYCALGQSGPVWYLAMAPSGSVSRSCTIPAGKAIMLQVGSAECSMVEGPPFYGGNEAELRTCADIIMDEVTSMEVKVDGVAVDNVLSYRLQSPLYTFTVPANNLLGVPAGTSSPSIADGIQIMLTPLQPGYHTIYAHSTGAGPDVPPEGELTWNLTVAR